MQDHLLDLYTWARGWPRDEHGRGPHIVELGVRTGNSTSAFLAALEVERRGHLWSVDIDEPQVPAEWHGLDCWSFLQASSRDRETLDQAPPLIDVLFLDTDPHTFESTYRELELWAPRVRQGGVILAHDTDNPETAEPARALQEYQRLHHATERELELRFKRGCHGLGIMRVR